jgi:hypothetical protein
LSRGPVRWLHAQGVTLFLFYLAGHHRFALTIGKDSADYTDMIPLGLFSRAALSFRRTLGYPLFLKAVQVFSPNLRLLPAAQLLVHIAAVYVFYRALRSLRLDGSGRIAVVLASCVLWADIVVAEPMFPSLMADSLACSLAIVTVSCVLFTLGNRHQLVSWTALALAIFLTYQVRPAYLYLLVAVPLMGLLVAYVKGLWGEPVARSWRYALGWSGAGIVPFLLFCCLRLGVVGHFGLVSFAGTNIISIAGQLLTPEMVPELPDDLRPLAIGLIETRQLQQCDTRERWQSPAQGAHRVYHRILSGQYICTCDAAQLVGERIYANNVSMDSAFSRLSLAVLERTPLQYLDYCVKSFRWAVVHALSSLFLVVISLWAIGYIVFRVRFAKGRPLPDFSGALRGLDLSLAIALPFFLLKMGLVVSVEVPVERYVDAAAVFLPMIPACLILALPKLLASDGQKEPGS